MIKPLRRLITKEEREGKKWGFLQMKIKSH